MSPSSLCSYQGKFIYSTQDFFKEWSGVYSSPSGLAIRKKTKINKIDALKEIIRAWGMNPEQVLARDALSDGATTYQNSEEFENRQLQILSNQLKQLIREETAV
jgi:hypothetical protein